MSSNVKLTEIYSYIARLDKVSSEKIKFNLE